jgi:hypothetical protein
MAFAFREAWQVAWFAAGLFQAFAARKTAEGLELFWELAWTTVARASVASHSIGIHVVKTHLHDTFLINCCVRLEVIADFFSKSSHIFYLRNLRQVVRSLSQLLLECSLCGKSGTNDAKQGNYFK